MPSADTFLSAYRYGACGLVVGVCPASKKPHEHPFSFPCAFGRTGACDWCETSKPGNLQ